MAVLLEALLLGEARLEVAERLLLGEELLPLLADLALRLELNLAQLLLCEWRSSGTVVSVESGG